jgi:hypothetical protein
VDLARLWCAFRTTDAVSSAPPIRADAERWSAQDRHPAIFAVFVVLGSVATLTMLGYLLVGVQYSAAAYITAD